MKGFVDIHHHLVYGVDDGPQTVEESRLLLRAAYEDGISRIIATAHATPGRAPLDRDAYLQKVLGLNAYCKQGGMALRVYPGSEIYYTDAVERALQTGRALTLAGSAFVLVEFDQDVSPATLQEAARRLTNAGLRPVFAHVERYDCLVRDVRHVRGLRDRFDVRMQVNCKTVVRDKGLRVRRFMRDMLEMELIDYVATDAHSLARRPPRMTACYEALLESYGREVAARLTGRAQGEIFLK